MLKHGYRKFISMLCIISMLIMPAGPVYAEAGNGTVSTDTGTRVYVYPEKHGPFIFGEYSAAIALSAEEYGKTDYSCTMDVEEVDDANLLFILNYMDDDHYAALEYEGEYWNWIYKNGKSESYTLMSPDMPLVFDCNRIILTASYTDEGLAVTVRNETIDCEYTEYNTDSYFLDIASQDGKTGYGIGYSQSQGSDIPEVYVSGLTAGNHKFSAFDYRDMSWYGEKEPVWGFDHLAISKENFPDDNLRNILLNENSAKKVKYDTDSDGYFSYSEVKNMEGILARNSNISDATGIELLHGIKSLNLSGNNLKKFGYEHTDKELNSLYIRNNQLESLELSRLPALTVVECDYNKLTELDISVNSELTRVMANHNNISYIDASQNPELKRLLYVPDRIRMDKRENFALADVNSFPEFIEYYNSVQSDDKEVTTEHLVYDEKNGTVSLEDTYNEGTLTFSVRNIPETFTFYIEPDGVMINQEHFPDPAFRSYVNQFDSNKDGALSETETDAVTKINVETKDIRSLKGIEYFRKLKGLYCGGNYISTLNLTGLTELEKLDCNYNQLKSIDLSNNKKLKNLDLTANPIEHIDPSQTPELKVLIIAETLIKEVDFGKLPLLEILLASESDIKEVDLSHNPKLNMVILSDMELTELDVSNNTELEALYCDNNRLTELDLSKNTKFKDLNCCHNRLIKLELPANQQTDSVYAYGNKIPYDEKMAKEVFCIPEDIRLEKKTGNSWDSIPGLITLSHRYFEENGYTWEAEHLIFDTKNKIISIEDGYDSGTVVIKNTARNKVIGGPFTFYYGEPDIDVSLSSAFTKVNDTTYKYTANGKHINARPIVKDKNGNILEADEDYFTKYNFNRRVNPGKYTIDVYGTGKHYGKKTINLIITPAAPSKVSARLSRATGGYDDAYIYWSASSKATGYYVYARRPSKTDSWSYLGRTTETDFLEKNLYDGYTYEFKVVPYITRDGVRYKSGKYRTAKVVTLKKVSTPSVGKYSSSQVRVRWSNIGGESGYQISRSTSKTGTYIVSTYKTTSGTSRVVKATKNKGYYYKVRAYRTVGDKKVYAPWSNVKYYKLR